MPLADAPVTGGRATPSAPGWDFPLAQLDRPQLEHLLGDGRTIADAYPLAPFQDHMLSRYLSDPRPGLYFVYQVYTLRGPLNVAAFERAWQEVVERHSILRTSFAWEGLAQPLQLVPEQARVVLERHDCRDLTPTAQQQRVQEYVRSIWRRGFDLSSAPHTRLALFHTGDETFEFVWSFNYMLQDGWSFPLILNELLAFYEAFSRGNDLSLARSRPYREYIAWLQRQDLAPAEAFWRATLRGFTAPTPLVRCAPGNAPRDVEDYVDQQRALPVEATTGLRELARRHHLTLNTLLQGAWALLLGGYTGEREVLFGSIVSGRPADLDGAESMVGCFNNLLPVRAEVPREEGLIPWLRALQAQQVEQRQYEQSPPRQIQTWSDMPAGQPLYESYLVFENYPSDIARGEHARQLAILPGKGITQTEHPLRVTVWPTQALLVIMSYYRRSFDDATIARMLGHIQLVLEAMLANPEQRIGELLRLFR